MATNATWTVVFDDKMIIKQSGDGAGSYTITGQDSFWNDSKWSNIWAIQYVADNEDHNDTVEYRDETPHATWTAANLGDFSTQFITKWDAAHLARLQSDWDADTLLIEDSEGTITSTTRDGTTTFREETTAEKTTRLGARPTSYSS